jgi:hypothetical protein
VVGRRSCTRVDKSGRVSGGSIARARHIGILVEMHPGQDRLRCTLVKTGPHGLEGLASALNRCGAGRVASCPPERFVNLIGNIAPGPADVVEILLGQPGQFAPHRVSVVPHMEDFAHLAKRPSE